MITFRRSSDRGHTRIGWLDSRHSFSFGDYHDPDRMGFRSLRVINDDRVIPGAGFGTHPHKDMEIISIVLSGALEHKDSLGNGEVLKPGEVQVMSAGSGIRHSEFNPSRGQGAHFLQVWIVPDRRGHEPRYDQAAFAPADRAGRLVRVAGSVREGVGTGAGAAARGVVSGAPNAGVASTAGGGALNPRGEDGALMIHQDADVHLASLGRGQSVTHAVRAGRGVYVHVVSGWVEIAGQTLQGGDAAVIEGEAEVTVSGGGEGDAPAEILLFDLA